MIKFVGVKFRHVGTDEACELLGFETINGVRYARGLVLRNGKKVIVGAPVKNCELI